MLDHPYITLILKYPDSFLPELFLILAIGAGLVNYSFLDKPSRWLFRMLVLSLIISLIQLHDAAYRQNNTYLHNLNSLVEMCCFATAYRIELKSRKNQGLILAGLIMYVLVFLYDFSWTQLAGVTLGVQRLIMIFYALIYFHHILSRMQVQNLLIHSMFWVSAGAIVHAAGTLFVFLFVKVTLGDLSSNGSYALYITIVRTFSAFFYIILLVSFWLRRREVKLTNQLTV
ncbi:hypothetical protein ACO2Q8_21315 [Larkinella sp. VNQ87]|uniref:hypothetical protein n=1 Tax=Larkinella sp. VNQ87 TaxID=3400921 RepID=UPI003C11FF87